MSIFDGVTARHSSYYQKLTNFNNVGLGYVTLGQLSTTLSGEA